MTEAAPIRDARGRLLPGARLPGSGRKPGRSQADLVRALIEPHRAQLIERALQLTKSDDPFAAANGLRICLERLAPAPRQESEKIDCPGMSSATTWAGKCDAVIESVSAGAISVDTGERALRLLDLFRRAHETDNLEARLRVLEGERAPITIDQGVDDLV